MAGPAALRQAVRSIMLAVLLFSPAACNGEKVSVPPQGVVELSDQFSSDFALVGGDGAPVASTDFRGRIMLVYFGFTTCPDVCPLALNRMSAALNELDDAEVEEIAPLFISVDPERDTPEAVKAYVGFDPRIIGLTGSPEAATAARASFKHYARRTPLPDSELGYTMDHTSLFYLVDRQGRPRLALHDFLTPAEMAVMLRRSLKW